MALREQPYLPLYIQDFLTDEKLAQCSAKATGVYIRLMCIMHKSEKYGKILLKQKFKQSIEQPKNFASQLVKHMPYDFHTVTESLVELLDENVLIIEGDILIQKRMVKDNEISELRSKAGKKGGEKTQENNHVFASDFAKANIKANSENEIVSAVGTSFEKSEKLFFDLTKHETQESIEYVHRVAQKQFTEGEMLNFWEAFKLVYKTDFYPSRNKLIQHFKDWLKKRDKKTETTSGKRFKFQ